MQGKGRICTLSLQTDPGRPISCSFFARCGIRLRSTRRHSAHYQHLRSRSVVSHISRKTSEIWPTQGLLREGNPVQCSGGTCCCSSGSHTRCLGPEVRSSSSPKRGPWHEGEVQPGRPPGRLLSSPEQILYRSARERSIPAPAKRPGSPPSA
jgi:hypothetical protein